MAVLVQTLIDQARLLSNLKANQFFSDDDIGGFVNDAGMELDDIFTDAYEHYSQRSLDFTLTGGVGLNSVPLPADFEKVQLLLKDPTLSNPCRIDPLPNMAERGSSTAGLIPGLGRCYLVEGDILEILPVSSAAGNYRLLYTPQLGALWPSPPDFTVRLATTGALPSYTPSGVGLGHSLFASANGALTIDGTTVLAGDFVLIKSEQSTLATNDGVYQVSQAGSVGTPWLMTRSTASLAVMTSVRVTAGATLANTSWRLDVYGGVIDTSLQTWNIPTLPPRFVPWQLFLKVHAAITIIQGRKQPMPDGLQAKMEQQRQRAIKLSANRTEGVTQAPLQRRTRGFWGDDAGTAGLG
jgi:hypothetical protein